MTKPIWVIGLGVGGALPAEAKAAIDRAGLLVGGQRLLARFPDHPAQKIAIRKDIPAVIDALQQRGDREAVVLASGDPGFHGIAGTLLKHFPAEAIRIIPNTSSLQAAFARAGLTWSEAVFTSAHAHALAEIVGWAKRVPRLGILTDPVNTPGAVAAQLLAAGVPDCRAIVAEDLGTDDERITDVRLLDLAGMEFGALNVLILVHDAGWRPAPLFAPRPEEAYAHRRGLITKSEVRALSLAQLSLRETDTAWDIGAGSGAVSIEMAAIAWRGRVYAVEHDPENLDYIRENAARYGALNLEVIEGYAPEALHDLPAPDAVFIGGTGGRMHAILEQIHSTGIPDIRIVINLTTLENTLSALGVLKQLGWMPDVTQINIARGVDIAGKTRLSPLNPVFNITARTR